MDFKCLYCLEPYNTTDKTPMVLTCLAHTICSDCLTFVSKNNSKPLCPFDSIPINISNCPINKDIYSYISSSLCKIHNQKISALCKTHFLLLCQNCLPNHQSCDHFISNYPQIETFIQTTIKNAHTKYLSEENEIKELNTSCRFSDLFHLFKNDSDSFFSEFRNFCKNPNFEDLILNEKIEEMQKLYKIINNRETENIIKRNKAFKSFLKSISCHNVNTCRLGRSNSTAQISRITSEIANASKSGEILQLFDKMTVNNVDVEFSAIFENLDKDLKIVAIGFTCPTDNENVVFVDYLEINNMHEAPFLKNNISVEKNPGRVCLEIEVGGITVRKGGQVCIFINMGGFCNWFEGTVNSEKFRVLDMRGKNYKSIFPILYFKVESL